MRLLVGSLIGLLVGKSYHTKQKDGNSQPTNSPTSDRINWIWMSTKIGLQITSQAVTMITAMLTFHYENKFTKLV